MYCLQVDRSRCGSRPYLLNVSIETSEGGGIVLDGALGSGPINFIEAFKPL